MTSNAAKPRRVYYLRDLLLGLLPLLLGIQCLGWITFFPNAVRGHADFRQLYAAGYMIRTGHAHELYDYRAQKAVQDALVGADEMALPFIRPAYQAQLFVPFSLFRYPAAYLMFLGVNVVLLAIAFCLLRPRLPNLARAWQGLPIFVFLVFYPVELSLLQGQDSILLLVLLAGAMTALGRGHELAGGAFVALGLFKLQIVIPTVLLFVLWRHWRFCIGFAFSASTLAAISMWTTGVSQTALFLRALFSVGGVAGNWISFPLRVNFMANVRGLVFGLTHSWLSSSSILTLTIVPSAMILGAAAFVARRQPADAQLSLAITVSVMVSYYLFIHDLTVLLIPILLTLDGYFATEQTSDPVLRIRGWTAALILVAPMCIFLMPDHFYLFSLPIFAFIVMLMWHTRREGTLAE